MWRLPKQVERRVKKMKKVSLVLVAILILLSGMLPGCNGDQPPTEQDMVRYIQHDWQIDASPDEIRQVLALADLMTGDSFFSEIGGILTVISMKKDMDESKYAEAAGKGVGWLFKLFLKETSFSWLSSYIGIALAAPDIAEWIVKEIDERCFNVQVAYYLCYREHGESEATMQDFVIPPAYPGASSWLASPKQLYPDCKLPPFPMAPAFTGKFTLEDVFQVGRAFWEAKQAEKYWARDEEAIEKSFVATLERLREEKPAMHVESINISLVTKDSERWVYTKVLITDAKNNSVSGADVYLNVITPATRKLYHSNTTDRSGTITFELSLKSLEETGPYKETGEYIATVTNVEKKGWKYDSSANIETSKTLLIEEKPSPTPPRISGKIAFVSSRDGNAEIYVMDADGRNQINLTNNPANDWDPAWSSDGKKIAFVSDRGESNKIYIMNANGSNLNELTEGEDPCWFPDGSKIIFTYLLEGKEFFCGSSKYPLYRLFTINVDGTEKKELYLAPSVFAKNELLGESNFKDPAISPDGRKIAFSAGNWDAGWAHSIYIISSTGEFLSKYWGELWWKRPDGLGLNDLFLPSWSPNGTKLIFCSYKDYHGGYSSRGAFFSDDVKFKWEKHNTELTGKWEPEKYEIWENSETWQSGKKLVQGDYPAWSPKGDKIAYTGKDYNIYIMDSDGSNIKQITFLGRNWDPDWSP